MKIRECLSFDDVLLVPQYSDIETRKEVNLSSRLSDELHLTLPIISSPMDTVTEWQMAAAMCENGGIGIIHRYNSIEEQCNQLRHLFGRLNAQGNAHLMRKSAAIGTTGDFFERAKELVYGFECQLLCVDVAHGHHKLVEKAIDKLKLEFDKRVHIMVGNVATYEGALALARWGADSIRIGIGGGSICSTKIQTGHGIATFQSIMDCVDIKNEFENIILVADGGFRTSGDIAKSIAIGADFVMLGSMLAGTSQSPGEDIEVDNKIYKTYRGMASEESQIAWRGRVSSREGVSAMIPHKGSVVDVLDNIKTNLASALSYSGARTIAEFQRKAMFVKQTHAGQIESSTHIVHAGGRIK